MFVPSNNWLTFLLKVLSYFLLSTVLVQAEELKVRQLDGLQNTVEKADLLFLPNGPVSTEVFPGGVALVQLEVSSNKPMNNVRASVECFLKDEIGEKKTKELVVDVYNLPVWEQGRRVSYRKGRKRHTVSVRELLLPNSEEFGNHGEWIDGIYHPPVFSSNFQASFGPQDKHILVKLKSSALAESGRYVCIVTFQANMLSIPLKILVDVLPFRPKKTSRIFGAFVRGVLSKNKRWISEKTFRAQLQNLREHNVNAIVLYERDIELLETMIHMVNEQKGFEKLILALPETELLDGSYVEYISSVELFSGSVFFATIDEPNSKERFANNLAVQETMDKHALATFTNLTPNTHLKLNSEKLSIAWANLSVYPHFSERVSKPEQMRLSDNQIVTYYWQSYVESNIATHRFFAGFGLYQSTLDGVFPYVYQAFHSIDPYLGDERSLGGRARRLTRMYKAFLTTYPANGAVIDTLQWEAFLEGTQDMQYVECLTNILQKASAATTQRVLSKLEDMIDELSHEYSRRPFEQLEIPQEKFRLIRDYIKLEILSVAGRLEFDGLVETIEC